MAEVLGLFEQAVLLAVVRLRDGAYGRAIVEESERRLGRTVAPGAVHATLDRLERKGLLSSHLERGTPVRGGRARRFYAVQPDGLRALTDARDVMRGLWHGVPAILKGRS